MFPWTGDWDGLDPMTELAKLRHMKVDDWRSQKLKEKEWQRAVIEVQQQQQQQQQQHRQNV